MAEADDPAAWVASYAEALGITLRPDDLDAILDLARLVAHGTERRNAPLATFLAGRFVERGGRTGGDAGAAIADARAVAERLLRG